MSPKKHKELSKHLSYVLRHRPDAIGIELDENGWTSVDALIAKSPKAFTPEIIVFIVENNDKKRFILSADGKRIRANQGHSVKVDLDLKPLQPPSVLFHGTAERFLQPILREGLTKMKRHHVHLSTDIETASKVGQRHGKLIILTIDARAMHEAGHVFYMSDNGVWLTATVPTDFISQS